ncbi:hypothetical protein FF1_028990 [Malus domestica]
MLSPQSIVRHLRVSNDRGYFLSKSFELMNSGGAVLEKDLAVYGKVNEGGERDGEDARQGMIVGPQEVPEHICTSYECRHFRQVVSVHCSYCGVGCGLHALVRIGHGVTDEGQRFWMLRDSYGEEGREDGNILIEKGKDVLGIDPRETWEFAPMRRLPWGSKWWGKLVKRSEHERLIEESWKEAERETGE